MNWQEWLSAEQQQAYFVEMQQQLAQRKAEGRIIYPEEADIYQAFEDCPLDKVKVVILGQDPYHGPKQAHGLSFSVPEGCKIPPSLRNIYRELADDIDGFEIPEHGNLSAWAKQGVLLLNTVLTVEQGKAHAHAKLGWEQFTSAALELVNQQQTGVVFLLWGAHAQKKGRQIDQTKHLVLNAVHPSPLSAYRGFFGCKHFSQANAYLSARGRSTINWQV